MSQAYRFKGSEGRNVCLEIYHCAMKDDVFHGINFNCAQSFLKSLWTFMQLIQMQNQLTAHPVIKSVSSECPNFQEALKVLPKWTGTNDVSEENFFH